MSREIEISAMIDMETNRATLFRRLDELGIAIGTVPYPAHETVEERQAPARANGWHLHQEPAAQGQEGALVSVLDP
ncbi:hypothetical protein [Manganibacter manganicus]|uniref:hypothetical protein n=1 Tax=Manganibacter manganicus TaxID=1873176 RepID=UPI001FD884CA|nr:hypothetical protein [Pseudaminobacter manganicus]